MKKIISFLLLILLVIPFIFVSKVHGTELNAVTVNMTYIFDNTNIIEQDPILDQTYGSTITVPTPSGVEGYSFAFWVVNGVVKTNPAENTFRVTGDMEIQVIFKPEGLYAAVFIDSNGSFIDVKFAALNGSVTPPSVVGYSKPGLSIKETGTWKDAITQTTSLANINGDRVFVLQYSTTSLSTYSVTVTNGSVVTPAPITDPSDKYNYNQIVEVTAPATNESISFSHWEDENGFRLSYLRNYKFTVVSNATLTAVYDDEIVEMPLVAMSDDLAVRNDYRTYIGQFHVPATYDLVEYGFLISNLTTPIMKGQSSVTTARNNFYTEATNEFVMSFPEDSHTSARAYLTVKNKVTGAILTVHSNRNLTATATDLFISEYIEGSSNNKAIEIFNGTGATVNLSEYSLVLYTNGSATPSTTLNLSGTLEHNGTYVVTNSSANAAITSVSNITSTVTNFNGNDAIALLKNSVIIDTFGVIGVDPGTSWTVGSGATAEFTLVRKPTVIEPTNNWSTSEWDVFPQDTSIYLGSHVLSPVGAELARIDLSFTYAPIISGTNNKSIFVGDEEYDPLENVSVYDLTDSNVVVNYKLLQNEVEITDFSFSTLTAGTYTIQYISINSLSNISNISIELVVQEVVAGNVLLYSTGFESTEGFTSGSTYNDTTPKIDGPTDYKWSFYYGTPSTTGSITGLMSAQMRYYTATPANLGYMVTNFNTTNVGRIEFKALNTNGNNVKVSISVDGGITWIEDQSFTLGTASADFIYNVPLAYQNQSIRVRFMLVPGTTNASRITIDDVKFYSPE